MIWKLGYAVCWIANTQLALWTFSPVQLAVSEQIENGYVAGWHKTV